MAQTEEFLNRISAHQNIMLDTNTIIYFLDGTPNLFDLILPLFAMVEQGHFNASLSVISEAELLVKPCRENNLAAQQAVNFFLDEFPNIEIIPLNREISRQAAQIRADSGLRLPDAIILATAIYNHCDLILGNDTQLIQKASSYISTILLNEYV